MKKRLIFYIIILLSLSASAQYEAQWTNIITENTRVTISSISAIENDFLICGTFQDSLVANKTQYISNGGKDVFLMQTDSIGQIKNIICFGSICDDMPTNIISKDNTLIIGGISLCSETDGEGELFIKSYGFDGGLRQEMSMPFIGKIRLGMISAIDSTIFIGGSLKGSIVSEKFEIKSEEDEHAFILGISDEGEHLASWQSAGTGRHRLNSIDVNSGKCMAVISVSEGTFITDTLPEIVFDKNGVVMLSMDNHLNTLWLVSAECDGFSEAVDIASTTEGELLGINFNGNLTINDSTFVSSGTLSSYIAQYDNDGKIRWQNILGGSYCRLLDVASADSLTICTGYYRGFMEIDNDTISQSSERKAFLLSLDDKGGLVWNINVETANNGSGKAMAYDGKGITLCTSMLQINSRNINGIVTASDMTKRNAVSRYVITDESEANGTEESNKGSDDRLENDFDSNDSLYDFLVNIFPNPTKNKLHWNVSNGDITTIEVYDTRGVKIETHSCERQTSGQIDVSTFPVGIYVLHFLSNNGTCCYEIIKN